MRGYKHQIICDLAETYHIYDFMSYKPSYIYVLVSGLRNDSRLKMAMEEQNIDTQTILSALAVDYLALLAWFKTKEAQKNRNRPESIYEKLMNPVKKKPTKGFNSAEDFEKARMQIIKKGGA